MNWFPDYNYILASKSPRRQQLLKLLGIKFTLRLKEVEEIYPVDLNPVDIPVYLAELKAQALIPELKNNDLLITADTIVVLEGKVLGKPVNIEDSHRLLRLLSGKEHQVISGVCLSS